jgi:hypothetical protein
MLVKSRYVIGLMRPLGAGGLDGRRGLAIAAECVHTSFDFYLRDAPAVSLKNASQLYPEVQVITQ